MERIQYLWLYIYFFCKTQTKLLFVSIEIFVEYHLLIFGFTIQTFVIILQVISNRTILIWFIQCLKFMSIWINATFYFNLLKYRQLCMTAFCNKNEAWVEDLRARLARFIESAISPRARLGECLEQWKMSVQNTRKNVSRT